MNVAKKLSLGLRFYYGWIIIETLTQFYLLYGVVTGAGIGIAGAFGSWIAGFVFDKTQSYQAAFVLVIIAFLLSGCLVWRAAPRKYRDIRY